MNSKIIFINENEDVFEVLDKENVEYSKKIVQHLRFISRKKSNNYIGYYQFKQNDLFYKLYILPKISPKVFDEKTNIKNFINLLKLYYELKSKYKEIKANEIFDNIIDFGFDTNDDRKNSDNIEDFINYKYLDALKVIEEFFKRHNRSINKEIDFMSQSIKNRLDLKRNIAELDKSKIHQIKRVPYLYSKIAIISIECINYFNTKDLNKTIKNRAKIINSKIKNKFKMKENFDFKLNQITSKKIKKLFKTKEQVKLYTALLQLIGVENYYNDFESKEIFKLYNQHSLFFRPEKLYEWFVYDRLVKIYPDYNILKDDYENGTKKTYKINKFDIDSKPDILVIDNNKRLFTIDVKWKMLDKNIPDISDMLKLKRDTEVRVNDYKKVYSLLIYPEVQEELYQEYLTLNDKSDFAFYTREFRLNIDSDILEGITHQAITNYQRNNLNERLRNISEGGDADSIQVSKDIFEYVVKTFSEEEIFKEYEVIDKFIKNKSLRKSDKMINLLRTSVAVVFYLDRFTEEDYADYTLPASSIWKAIETELKDEIEIYLNKINDNVTNKKEKYRLSNGVTLGTYSYLFGKIIQEHKESLEVFNVVLDAFDKELSEYSNFFKKITDQRNSFTHNHVMDKNEFYDEILIGIFTNKINTSVIIDDIIIFHTLMKENK
jgi:hypothetical protein